MDRSIDLKYLEEDKVINKNYNKYIIIGFFILLILLIILSLMVGRYSISITQVMEVLLNRSSNNEEMAVIKKIILNVRLPRIFASIFVGAALSISGASYQSIFKNPMVSPDLLGVTSGAGFGAAIAILLNQSYWKIQLFAFLFGLIGVFISLTISKMVSKGSEQKIIVLILSGIVVGTLFKSLISIVKYLADPNDALKEITFWLMGSVSGVYLQELLKICIPVIIGVIPIILLKWQLNGMAFGDEEAKSLGIDTDKIRIIFIISSTIITASSISICGIIGWVGLIVPHISRFIVGSNNKYLIPTSLILGGIYLLGIDNISRTLFPIEIPLGILTSLIGTPFFLYLLFRSRRVW